MTILTSLTHDDLSYLRTVIDVFPTLPDDFTIAVALGIEESAIPIHRSATGITDVLITLGSAAAMQAFAKILSAYFASRRTDITLRHRGQTFTVTSHDSTVTAILQQLESLLKPPSSLEPPE